MTEWQPRALHFPPQSDGWDCALLAAPEDPGGVENLEIDETSALYRWREEVSSDAITI